MRTLGLIAPAALLVAAIGFVLGARTGAQTPSPINPVGTYQVTTASEEGTPLAGTLTIQAANGNYSGQFVSTTGETVPLRQVTTSASHVMMAFDSSTGLAVAWLERQADGTFTGSWHPLTTGINLKVVKKQD